MKIRRGTTSGTRAEALRRVAALEERCSALEHDVCALGIAERLRQAMTRIADLEEKIHRRGAA